MAEPLSLSRSRREPRLAKRFEQEFGDGAQATSKKQIKQGYAASNRTASHPHLVYREHCPVVLCRVLRCLNDLK